MFVERFIFPSESEEREYLMSGRNTVGMPAKYDGNVPFGVFSKRDIYKLDFGDITLLAGSSNSEKHLLMRIIAAKLGVRLMPHGISDRCLSDYLDLCMVKCGNYTEISMIPFDLITKEQSADFVNSQYANIGMRRIKSLVEFYEERIIPRKLYLIEEPETAMSLRETEELALLLRDFAKASGNQFIVTTNSPVMLGIKDAVIYDLDSSVITGEAWSRSRLAGRHIKFYRELESTHKRTKYLQK